MNIAQKESVTQLTLKGVYSLLDENKKEIVVQVIEPEAIVNQKSDNKSLKFKVFISDGYTKHKAVLGNEASLAFDAAGQPAFCVIRVLELMQQNAQPQKRLVIITKIELINTDVDELIGAPIEYQEWLASNKQNRGGSNQIPPRFLGNFRSQNQANNYMNNNFGNTSNQNTANSFNRQQQQQQPAANQNQNQRAPAPASGLNNFNGNQQAPSRNSMGGGNFNSNNNNNSNNNFNNNNNQRPSNNNNSNKVYNQNENIPPSGGNNFKGQQEQKRGPVSYINHNQFNVPEEEFLALNVLAPYAPFVIKVRITSKSDLRTFNKQGGMGEGHVFSADLIDKEGNEITASFFGDAAVKFAPILEENAVYIMRNGNVKMVNSKFNRKSNNDYQIVFDKADSFIQKVEEDTNIMVNKFNFVKLSTIEELPVDNTPIDVAAYIRNAGETTEVTLKTGNQPKKARRVITLYDNSNTLVEMTLWGDICNSQDLQPDTLVLIKAARVSAFNNIKSLSSSFSTKIIARQDMIPDVPEINQLKEWKNSEFDDSALNSKVSERGSGGKKFDSFTIEEISKLTDLSTGKTIDTAFFDLYAYVSHIKTESPNLYYAACPTQTCKRKVIENDGIFTCNHCPKNTNDPLYRYTLTIKISDHTGSLWVSAFDTVATAIIGHEAKEIKAMKDQGNDARIAEIFKDAHHKEFEFKLIAKMDTYAQQDRIKFQAIRVEKINYVKHGNALLNELDKYSQKN